MSRDHMLGFPALPQSLEESGARSPKYGLGVPTRAYDEARAKAERLFAPGRQVIAFEQGDHTPVWMRTPQKPLKWPPLPDADGWIKWDGGEQPVDGIVEVRIRCGLSCKSYANKLRWGHLSEQGGIVVYHGDIVAYRVVE